MDADKRRIEELSLDPNNANKGTRRGAKLLDYSLREFRCGRSIVSDKKRRVIGGNKTLVAAQLSGVEEVIVVHTNGEQLVVVQRDDLDLDDAKTKAMAIADNRTAEVNLAWDGEVLRSLLSDVDLSVLFSENELEKIIGQPAVPGDLDETGAAVFELAEQFERKWGTAFGQRWEIPSLKSSGAVHRISCADSTDLPAIERLMAGSHAQMCFTDPPWGVDLHGGDHGNRRRKGVQIANDSLPPAKFQEFLAKSFAVIAAVADGDLYCVMASSQWPVLDRILRDLDYHWSGTLIWVKQSQVLTRRKYHSRFEPIWYGWHKQRKSSFCAGRDQDDVWEFPRPLQSPEHPTKKPVDLVARAIFNSSQPGDIVFEPFSGSGTTLLAAESWAGICYANELLPKYVAVALERLARCGLQPKLVGG